MPDFISASAILRKSIAVSAVVLLVALIFVTFRYRTVTDFPKCTHNHLGDDGSVGAGGAPKFGCTNSLHTPDSLDITALKNGDILCVSYADLRSVFSTSVYGSVWNHCGVVWVDPKSGEPHVLEVAVYKAPYSSGVVRVPLITWCNINKNARSIALLSINRAVDSAALDTEFKFYENRDIGIEGLNLRWFRFLGKRTESDLPPTSLFAKRSRQRPPTEETYPGVLPDTIYKMIPKHFVKKLNFGSTFNYVATCHEVLISTLQNVGVLDSTYTPCSYLPSAIFHREIPAINGYSYAEPVEVSVGYLVQNN